VIVDVRHVPEEPTRPAVLVVLFFLLKARCHDPVIIKGPERGIVPRSLGKGDNEHEVS
jgi:hypothetical protein